MTKKLIGRDIIIREGAYLRRFPDECVTYLEGCGDQISIPDLGYKDFGAALVEMKQEAQRLMKGTALHKESHRAQNILLKDEIGREVLFLLNSFREIEVRQGGPDEGYLVARIPTDIIEAIYVGLVGLVVETSTTEPLKETV